MTEYQNKLTIKAWAEEDRPREKLLLKGKRALSDAELIAIIIGSGNKNESAVELAKRILSEVKNDLNELGKLSVKDLMKYKGIGEAKAISIVAALELGLRRQSSEIKLKDRITSSRDVDLLFRPLLAELPYEEFWVLYLNKANNIIGREKISAGGVSGTVADVRIIFKKAVELLASSIVLCHNHPSGNLVPSKADFDITKKLKQGGLLLEIEVHDHVIVSETGYYSFADEGMM